MPFAELFTLPASIGSSALPLCKLAQTIGEFTNNNKLLKLLYIGIQNAINKWMMPIQNWNPTLSQLSYLFTGQLDGVLGLSWNKPSIFMLTQNFKAVSLNEWFICLYKGLSLMSLLVQKQVIKTSDYKSLANS